MKAAVFYGKEDLRIEELPIPEREGFDFLGWYEVDGDTSEAVTETRPYELKDATYRARWRAKVNLVIFVTNGGEPIKAKIYEEGESLPVPIRDGYHFGGWFKDEALSEPCMQAPKYGATLYARWTEETPARYLKYEKRGNAGEEYIAITGKESAALPRDLVIPEYIGGIKVTEIEDYAFEGSAEIRSVKIPESVERIGFYIFKNCKNVKDITLSVPQSDSGVYRLNQIFYCEDTTGRFFIPVESVTVTGADLIPDEMFYSCEYLKSVTLPDTVKSIGYNAFCSCESLKDINFSESLTVIYESAFAYCGFEFLVLPDSLLEIRDYAFYGCDDLLSVTLGKKLQTVYPKAFEGCYKIAEVVNNSATAFGQYDYDVLQNHSGESRVKEFEGFYFYTVNGEHYLLSATEDKEELILPPSYEGENYTVRSRAFWYNEKLVSLDIGDGVKSIQKQAFYRCDSLRTVKLGNSLTEIGESAFEYCYKLKEIINNSALELSDYSYGYISNYSILIHNGISSVIEERDGFYFIKDGNSNVYLFDSVYTGDIVLPDSFDGENYRIAKYAFVGRDNITSVKLGAGTVGIDDYAFPNCYNLKEVIFNEGLIYIGPNAFSYNYNLTSLVLPDSLTDIYEDAFYDCTRITDVYIGKSLKSVRGSAFLNCETLRNVYYSGTESEFEKIDRSYNNERLFVYPEKHYEYVRN